MDESNQSREDQTPKGSAELSTRSKIEAILFYKAESVSVVSLSETLEISQDKVKAGLDDLRRHYEGSGLSVIFENDQATLTTAPKASTLIEKIRKKETSGNLGKAALECLTIILYRGPIARVDIDYIRGVNSQSILRRLSVRGLIEKQEGGEGTRRKYYQATHKLLEHLGISQLKDLPEYEKVEDEFNQIITGDDTEGVEGAHFAHSKNEEASEETENENAS